MAPLPRTSDFASFRDLHCSSASDEQKCIWYLTQNKRTCGHRLNSADRIKAFELRTAILRSLPHETSLEQLKEYARLKSCNQAHRIRFIESGLIEPLARRWQQELSHGTNLHNTEIPSSPLAVAESSTIHERETFSQPAPRIIQTRLRSRQGTQIEAASTSSASVDSASPAFRPYKSARPQSVSSKLLAGVTSKSQTGSIYLYTRTSSPGYVKIGYTCCSVEGRLKSWRKSCGYEPILLTAFDDVPHVRKVESLIHHQLADVWRAERLCRNCCREHQEWFEIDKEDAVRVAGQWAEWMKQAQPYGVRGYLKGIWVDEIEKLEMRGVPVTAEALLSAQSRLLEPESRTVEEVQEDDNTIRDATSLSLFADELTAEPDTELSRLHDLGSVVVAMLQFMQGLDRSLQRTSQALVAADALRRARIDQAYGLGPVPARSERQDTGATVASEA